MRNLKKVIALVAVFAMLVSTVAFADTFSDVAASDNYAEAIETLSDLGIITGDDQDGDGTMDFRPADTITRAEVAAIISRIQGMNSVAQAATNFADVPSTHWASGYVNNAEGRGIINGYGDGNFGPEDNVKYEEAIKMLMVTLGYEPFAADNGGYPTGYIAAAQRYGVLDDVIGGGVGTEAPRGMIAQLVFNAIDTPLMDKSTYGANAEYVIYDGVNYNFDSLLLRDLGIIKVTGKVVANSYSAGNIDTAADATIEIDLDETTDNLNYAPGLFNKDGERTDSDLKLYQADIDADAFLGYAVVAYAAETTRSNKYNLVSIRGDYDEDDIASFTLDQYDAIEVGKAKSTLEYMKNDTDKNATKLSVENDAAIYYNGSAATGKALTDFFADANDTTGWIVPDSVYSGMVTLIDSNDVSGYDVVVIEIGASAVVKEVKATTGRVSFLNDVVVPSMTGSATSREGIKYLEFDEDATDVLIKLTKDGDAIDYTELKEWDVLAIVYNPGTEVYNVEVMGEANSVVGAVESMKGADADKEYKLSDGNWYKVVKGAYQASSLQVGSSGKFYVDAYGKIVALDVSVEVPGVSGVASDNYAYILRALVEPDTWGKPSIVLQIMDKVGNVYEGFLASSTKITQGTASFNAKPGDDTWSNTVTSGILAGVDTPDELVALLQNKLVTYASNSNDEVKEIVLAAEPGDTSGKLVEEDVVKEADYDEDNMLLDGYVISEDTYVFYIGGRYDSIKYGSADEVDKNKCSVGTGATFAETKYAEVHIFDIDDATDAAKCIVVMNQGGMVSPLTNIAVIESIGTTSADGYDVASVEYWMNGELKTATTDPDALDEELGGIADSARGDLYKLALEGDVITSAEAVLVFDRQGEDKPFVKDATEAPLATVGGNGNGDETDDEAFYFGAVTKVTDNGSVTIALLDENGDPTDVKKTFKENADTNAYLFDSQLKYSNALDLGSLTDADIFDDLFIDGTVKVDGETITGPAYGMLDYVFVRTYNRRVADVVVYKNYEFDYDVVDAK